MTPKEPVIHLLLVDDEVGFLEATARALGRRGVAVRTATTGETALRLLEHTPADVAVLDVKMPGMDGVTLFDRVQQRWPELPVILLTGHGTIRQAFETSRHGVFEYLAKPCPLDRLLAVLQDAYRSRHPEHAPAPGPIRVLLVDDEADLLTALAPPLRRRGLEVETCTNGAQALDLLDRRRFEVVVLDVRMPGLDGLQVLRWIKARRATTEVILLSGHPSVSAAVDGLQEGAFDYLTKPISADALVGRIHEAVNRLRGREAASADRLLDDLRPDRAP